MCGKKQPPKKRNRPHGAGTVYKVSGPRRKAWAAARNKKLIGYFYTREDALKALERTLDVNAPFHGRKDTISSYFQKNFKREVRASLWPVIKDYVNNAA